MIPSIQAAGVAIVLLTAGLNAGAEAASDISVATIAAGHLYVIGLTDKPNASVVLDKRFHTTSDGSGRFSFEEIYHPATCIVSVDVEVLTYRAVVSNCAQQMPIGVLPFVGAAPPRFATNGSVPSAALRPPENDRPTVKKAASRPVQMQDGPRRPDRTIGTEPPRRPVETASVKAPRPKPPVKRRPEEVAGAVPPKTNRPARRSTSDEAPVIHSEEPFQ